MYKNLTIENPSSLKRFSHRKRFIVAIDLLDIKDSDAVLDYGTGDGFLLLLLARQYPGINKLAGFEPMEKQYKQLRDATKSLKPEITIFNELPNQTSPFSKISCLEVLEHMTTSNQLNILKEIRFLLNDRGRLVLSVPIEVGFSGLMKNIARLLLRQTHSNTSLRNVIKSTFYVEIERPNEPYISSHVGFNYRKLEHIFPTVGYRIVKKTFSPLPIFRGILNSQVFYLLEKTD